MKSPCIKICKLDNNVCIACKRSLEEIRNWSQYSDEQRELIMMDIKNNRFSIECYMYKPNNEVKK
jgi:predicted Fe-S protein YdhL (DUF1289 family)